MMYKKDAIQMFGSVKKISEAIDTTPQNFYMFADPLSNANADRMIGAAIRNGIAIPVKFIKKNKA